MNRFVKCFENQFLKLAGNKGTRWPNPHIFVGIDVHETVMLPTYSENPSQEYYPLALESLRLMSEDPEVVLILWSCSKPVKNKIYKRNFFTDGVDFKYINENPECANTPYGDYTKKLYFNVGLDDKFGFSPEEDWPAIYRFFLARKTARELKKAS